MDYLLPTAMETPAWETDKTITPSPHHPLGAKGVGESATVGAPPAIANAVVDALSHLGVGAHRHPDDAPEGLGDPAREGRRVMAPGPGRACSPRRRARGGRRDVRVRHGGGGPASHLGPAGRAGIVHPGRHDRGLGRRQLRPARRRPRGAPVARRRPAAPPPALEGRRPREGRRGDGIVELVMTCHSGGTLEIYVEPHLPAPSALGRRHDADRRRARGAGRRDRLAA